jgi:glycosyltransferase involved in cell wall biosynthesis
VARWLSLKPAIAVIIVTHNQSLFLKEALFSVLYQEYSPIAVLLFDNGSDETHREKFHAVTKDFFPIFSSKNIAFTASLFPNRGSHVTRNCGAAIAANLLQPEWLLFLDGDDTLHPEYLAKCVKVISEDKSLTQISSFTQHFGEQSDINTYAPYSAELLRKQNLFPVTSLIKTSLFTIVGGFDTHLPYALEDWGFWLKGAASDSLKSYRIKEPLFNYRILHNSQLRSLSAAKNLLSEALIATLAPNLFPIEVILECHSVIERMEPSDVSRIEGLITVNKDRASGYMWLSLVALYQENFILAKEMIKEVFDRLKESDLFSYQPLWIGLRIASSMKDKEEVTRIWGELKRDYHEFCLKINI